MENVRKLVLSKSEGIKTLKLTIFTAVFGLGVFAFPAETQAAGSIIYVDNTAENCTDGATTYNPDTKSCGSGNYKIYTTIQKGADNAAAGITVKVRAGKYNERVAINNSGTEIDRITIEGEEGAIIDGYQGILTGTWTEDLGIGQGVYKYNSTLPYEATVLTWDDNGKIYDIPKVNPKPWAVWGDVKTWKAMMGYPANYLVPDSKYNEYGAYGFWENIGAMYYSNEAKELYVRFKNYDNPVGKVLRWGGNSDSLSTCVKINDKANITIKNFHIRGCMNGMQIWNSGAKNNIIENNVFYTGQQKLEIHTGAANNEIKNNEFFMPLFSDDYTPGAWEGCRDNPAGCTHEQVIAQDYYFKFKNQFAKGEGLDELNIGIAASNNKIHDNKIHDTLGIGISGGSGNEIYNNEIYNVSFAGMYINGKTEKTEIHDNLVYNVTLPFRLGSLNLAGNNMQFYYYRNKIWNHNWTGGNYFHFDCDTIGKNDWPVNCDHTVDGDIPEVFANIYIYHNTFIGGRAPIYITTIASEWGGIEGTFFVNNIFSSPMVIQNGSGANPGGCRYNWMGGDKASYRWCDNDFNKKHPGEYIWNNNFTSVPNFRLPSGSDAIDSGKDVSKTLTIDGKTIGPLPGFLNNYWKGSGPDMGAVEYEEVIYDDADVDGSGTVNIKDIQICIKAIVDPDSFTTPDQLNQLAKCKAVAPPPDVVNIKDIQEIIQKIINP